MLTKIYILSGPDGRVRYVGKTTQLLRRRLTGHLSQARVGRKRDHHVNWLRSIGLQASIDLVEAVEGSGAAEEIALIAGLRSLGVALTNETAGGEGHLGRKRTQAEKDSIRAKALARGAHSVEHGRNIGRALLGKKPPLAAIAASRAATLGVPKTPEHRRKLSESNFRHSPSLINQGKELLMLGWTISQAAAAIGLSRSGLHRRLMGAR